MTEKLLTRPPFRYIHDIFSAAMEATGFGEGLYTAEELDAKSIKDKEGKIMFLDKLITLVQAAAGEEIPVKSSKVVAGHEPEATNIFLQYLFKVATSGIDSAPIVAQILGGEEEGQGNDQEDDEDDDGEEAARIAAEEEEQRKKDKRASKKKEMEEEQRRQAQEQEKLEKQKRAQEEKEKAQKEAQKAAAQKAAPKAAPKEAPKEVKKAKPQPVEEPANRRNMADDGVDDDDEDDQVQENDIGDIDPESKFGKKAMAQLRAQEEDENEQVSDDGGAGTGIKMGKIGGRRGKKKAGGVERSEPVKKGLVASEPPKRSYGGYNEEDIEYMRKAIQSLCQSTNPLGKSIDFVTEDIDSMVKEYEHWKQDYAESQIKLEEQQRITEQTIQPLQDVQLAQLEDQIREERSKIQNIRSQIIRNDNTITNLLQSVISSG